MESVGVEDMLLVQQHKARYTQGEITLKIETRNYRKNYFLYIKFFQSIFSIKFTFSH